MSQICNEISPTAVRLPMYSDDSVRQFPLSHWSLSSTLVYGAMLEGRYFLQSMFPITHVENYIPSPLVCIFPLLLTLDAHDLKWGASFMGFP